MKLPAFADVQVVMDRAAESPSGIRYRLPHWGQIINFRQRCYRFRVQQQKLARVSFGEVPGFFPTTPYDDLELWIEDSTGQKVRNKPLEPHPYFDLVIRHRQVRGQILDLDEYIELEGPRRDSLELDDE